MAKWKNLYEDEDLRIGMWTGMNTVYFIHTPKQVRTISNFRFLSRT